MNAVNLKRCLRFLKLAALFGPSVSFVCAAVQGAFVGDREHDRAATLPGPDELNRWRIHCHL